MLWPAVMIVVLLSLIFVVGGTIFGLPQKIMRGLLLGALLLVLIYLLWNLPVNVIGLCLFMALVLAARLMFFRAP
jgi:hypothetical protein